jgi:hypothetical protein
MAVSYEFLQQARAFVPGKPFQSSLMFVGKAKPTRVKQLSVAPLYGRLLALITNIRLDCKGLPDTNVLDYYKNS